MIFTHISLAIHNIKLDIVVIEIDSEFTLKGNPDVQTESMGQVKQWVTPSGECCPGGHKERVPLAGSHEKPAGHNLQSTLSSELIRPGKQGCKTQKWQPIDRDTTSHTA